MAKAMWTYTDGYSLKMTSSNIAAFNPLADTTQANYANSKQNQFLCLSKTTAAAKDHVGRAADGYMCFIY